MGQIAAPAGAVDTSRHPYWNPDGSFREDATFADIRVRQAPFGFYQALREHDPVHYDPVLDMYLIARYEDLQAVMADPITFSVKKGYDEQNSKGFQQEFRAILNERGGGFHHDAIMTDPPEHTRIRRLLEPAFSAHRVKSLEPQIREIVVSILESVADQGHADGVNDIASPITIRVICAQLGLYDIDPGKISEWSDAAVAQIGRMQDREQMLANADLYCELQNHLIKHMEARRQVKTEDMLSDMVHAKLDDDKKPTLDFGELVSLGRTLLVGGNDTTATGIANMLLGVASRPEIAAELARVAEDDRALNRFVEEMLRVEPPTHGLSRMATRDVEVGGKLLPKGAHILLLYASANDDPGAFPNPRDFDPTRGNIGRHVTFGNGVHRCVGLALARMEVKITAQEVARRLTDLKLTVPIDELEYLPGIATRALASLPLSFRRK